MLRTIFALAKMHLNEYNIYKSNFYLFSFNRLIEVVVYIFVWQAIYYQTRDAGGFTLSQMITYYILVVSINPIVLWGINEDMGHSIRTGRINKELLNPISYFKYYFGMNLGEIAFAVIVGIAVFVVCAIFWGVTLPVSFLNFIIFLVLILLGIPITFFLQMIAGTVGFYSGSIWGIQILRKAVISIFAGVIAPITLFPAWFQALSNYLPFQELIYTPINIWIGEFDMSQIGFVLIKQVIWIVILYIIAKKFFEHAVKKITINGG